VNLQFNLALINRRINIWRTTTKMTTVMMKKAVLKNDPEEQPTVQPQNYKNLKSNCYF